MLMIRELLTTLLVAALAVPAMSVTTANDLKAGNAQQHRGVKLTPEQLKVVQAVSGTPRRHSIPSLGHTATKQIPLNLQSKRKAPQRVNASGSKIQGWRISDEYASMPSGWYELDLDGTETFMWDYHDPNWVDDGWSDEPPFPFTTGFYQDDKVIGFHSEVLLYWLIWGYGSFNLDGEILEYQEVGGDLTVTDFSTYVISCVHDSNTGDTYAYTLNADASGYMLQKVDTESWQFTPIVDNVPIENVCLGIAFNPDDGKIYGYTPDSRFVTFDGATGNLTFVAKFDFPVTTTMKGMTYSPLDKEFMFVYTGSDSSEYASLYTITPEGELTFHADLPEALQYNILITPDKVVDPLTPLTPEITDIAFEGGSVDGTATIKLPSTAFDGSTLSGNLTLTAIVDGVEAGSMTGQPGETVNMPLNDVAEGMRNFSFTVTCGELTSASVSRKLYVGYDTPVAPENISLTEGTLTWDPVTQGVNGGYIDSDALTYNIYLNGEKINDSPVTGCSYTFTMPDEVYRKYVAQVEADNHGHLSQQGFSNDIKTGKPFPLPFSMKPTMTEGELIQMFSDRGIEWYKWNISQDAENPYISCNTFSYDEPTEEWFILPAISVPATDKLLEISFDVKVQPSMSDIINETIAVAYGDNREPVAMQDVKCWDRVQNTEEWQTLTAWCLPAEGTTYFGFKTLTHENSSYLMVRNISIRMSDRSEMTPAEVTALTAEALPQGALKAHVHFTMPTLSASGSTLPNETLTATVKTTAGEVSVTGMPGSVMSADVPTAQGWNDITVTAANANVGLDNSVRIFTGIDVPKPLDAIRTSHSADYRSLHLEWDAPTEGYNGGYVDPSTVEYALYNYDQEEYEWRLVRELGTSRELDITPEIAEGMAIAEGAILTQNTQGNSGIILQFGAPAGNPYELPMIENLNDPDHWGPVYEPLMLERPDETYSVDWGYMSEIYPYHVSQPTPYGVGAMIAFGENGNRARISLPAFSTKDVESAAIELPIWCGPESSEIAVYAEAYGSEPELIGTFYDSSEECWRKHRFQLPAKYMDKDWVVIKVVAIFKEESTKAAFADYRIKTFYANDLGVTAVSAPIFAEAGREVLLSSDIENTGLQTVEMPRMEMLVYNSDKLVATLPMECGSQEATLDELETAHFSVSWIPDGNACGGLRLTARIANDDMDMTNNTLDASCQVTAGNQYAIHDLKATLNDRNVVLNWTEPAVESGKEGFENHSSFYFGDKVGDFKTVSLDGMSTTYFAAFRFPYDTEAKSWQVLGENEMTEIMEAAEVENDMIHACSGNNVLAAFVPLSYMAGEDLYSNKWLISPEVTGGSNISFMLSSGITGYMENVDVMYSETDDNPESFQPLESLTLLSANWTRYEYTLPANARYFAIVHKSSYSGAFFVMVDDICYEPAGEAVAIQGYDIMRDGVVINENVAAHGNWTDNYLPENGHAVYNVVPVLARNGALSRGVKSNDAATDTNGIESVTDNCLVTASKGCINIMGCEGKRIDIYSVDGILHASIPNASTRESVKVDNGIYIVRTGAKAHRLNVR